MRVNGIELEEAKKRMLWIIDRDVPSVAPERCRSSCYGVAAASARLLAW